MIKNPKEDLRPGDVLVWTGRNSFGRNDVSNTITTRKDDDSGWWCASGGLADSAARTGPWIAIRTTIQIIGEA